MVEADVLEQRLEQLDANLRLEPVVERALQLMALDFAEEVVTGASQLAKHRKASQVRLDFFHPRFLLLAFTRSHAARRCL